jgi:hypothetical protein
MFDNIDELGIGIIIMGVVVLIATIIAFVSEFRLEIQNSLKGDRFYSCVPVISTDEFNRSTP